MARVAHLEKLERSRHIERPLGRACWHCGRSACGWRGVDGSCACADGQRRHAFRLPTGPDVPNPPWRPSRRRPPDGWTHLVSKSQPELASGDVDKLHAQAAGLARFLFSCLLARVERQETAHGVVYRLDEVATGLGTKIGKADVIISSETQSELGANWGSWNVCSSRGGKGTQRADRAGPFRHVAPRRHARHHAG